MTARAVDGLSIAAEMRRSAMTVIRELREQGHDVRLDAIMVGQPPAGEIYARSQENRCREVGISYKLHALPQAASMSSITALIHELNAEPSVTGILLNLPLPEGIDTPAVQYHIDPYKDIEGVNPANIGLLFYDEPIIAPCTALAVMEILRRINCKPVGMEAVVIGQGPIAGRPIALFLQQQLATVTVCHKETRDLAAHTRNADLLVVAAGRPQLIGPEHVKPGAIVIDVGINRVEDHLGQTTIVGDVQFDAVKDVASIITPVPGGVGPVTVAVLLTSAVEATRKQIGPRRLMSSIANEERA